MVAAVAAAVLVVVRECMHGVEKGNSWFSFREGGQIRFRTLNWNCAEFSIHLLSVLLPLHICFSFIAFLSMYTHSHRHTCNDT